MAPARFHHARDLAHAHCDVVAPRVATDLSGAPCAQTGRCDLHDDWHEQLEWNLCYAWLAERVGFWPLFLAVGETDDDRQMTGYAYQWQRAIGWRPTGAIYREAGDFPSTVLFSWIASPHAELRFVDYVAWHIVLNSLDRGANHHELRLRHISRGYERQILRPSWSASRWLRRAAADPHGVQAVVPEVDLRTADEVWCRNQAARRELIRRGFEPERVEVRRLPVRRNW